MKKQMMLSTLLIAMLTTGGCSSVTGVSKQTAGDNPNVVIENRSFSNKLAFLVVEDFIDRRVGNLLQAQATVRNTTTFEMDFKYQFRFFDKDGFIVGDESRPWAPVILQGKESKQVKVVAPNPSATTVKIFIRD